MCKLNTYFATFNNNSKRLSELSKELPIIRAEMVMQYISKQNTSKNRNYYLLFDGFIKRELIL